MQFHRTLRTPRRGRRVALASLIGGALLLVPAAAFAQPAHAAELAPGIDRAPGLERTVPGNAYGRPAPPVSGPALSLVSVEPTSISASEFGSATVTVHIDAPAGINAAYLLADGAQADGEMSPVVDEFGTPDGSGNFTGRIVALPSTPLGPLAWRAVLVDGSNVQTVLEGPALDVTV
jgi:hypothetical protein